MNDRLSDIEWRWKRFGDLMTAEVYNMLAARCAVFVVEQNCVYGDIDGLDLDAWHLLAYGPVSENETRPALAGYLRVLLPDFPNEGEKDVRIGRVLTPAKFRGLKLGNAMLEHILAHWPDDPVSLHAQAYLQKFYGAFGFVPSVGIHDEDGIPHVWIAAPAFLHDLMRPSSS